MYSIEFRTQVKNGTVEVPAEHRDKFTGGVKVILMAEEYVRPGANMIDQLLANPLAAPGFRPLTRDEAHAR